MERLIMKHPVISDPPFLLKKFCENRSHRHLYEIACVREYKDWMKEMSLQTLIPVLPIELSLDDILTILDHTTHLKQDSHMVITSLLAKDAAVFLFGAEYYMTMINDCTKWDLNDYAAILKGYCNHGLHQSAKRIANEMILRIGIQKIVKNNLYDFTEPLLCTMKNTISKNVLRPEDQIYYSSPEGKSTITDTDDNSTNKCVDYIHLGITELSYGYLDDKIVQILNLQLDPFTTIGQQPSNYFLTPKQPPSGPLKESPYDSMEMDPITPAQWRGAIESIRNKLSDEFIKDFLTPSARKSNDELEAQVLKTTMTGRNGTRVQIADCLVLLGHDFNGLFLMGRWNKKVWKTGKSPCTWTEKSTKKLAGLTSMPPQKRIKNRPLQLTTTNVDVFKNALKRGIRGLNILILKYPNLDQNSSPLESAPIPAKSILSKVSSTTHHHSKSASKKIIRNIMLTKVDNASQLKYYLNITKDIILNCFYLMYNPAIAAISNTRTPAIQAQPFQAAHQKPPAWKLSSEQMIMASDNRPNYDKINIDDLQSVNQFCRNILNHIQKICSKFKIHYNEAGTFIMQHYRVNIEKIRIMVSSQSTKCYDDVEDTTNKDDNSDKQLPLNITLYHTPINVGTDGNCLFRALALAVLGDQSMYPTIRLLVTYAILISHREEFTTIVNKRGSDEADVIRNAIEDLAWGQTTHYIMASAILERPVYLYQSFPENILMNLSENLQHNLQNNTYGQIHNYVDFQQTFGQETNHQHSPIMMHFYGMTKNSVSNHFNVILKNSYLQSNDLSYKPGVDLLSMCP